MSIPLRLSGVDAAGGLRQAYADRLAAMDRDALFGECRDKVWLSAFAESVPASDFHWQAEACRAEAESRGELEVYHRAVVEQGGKVGG
jgi:hypothetical protein